MRQVVVEGGPGVRKGGYGLYELMHSVDDSFSGAHTSVSGDGSNRRAPHLEASDANAGTGQREARTHPRLRVPHVGRPPRQDLRDRGSRDGGRARVRGPHRPSVPGALRMSLRGGRPRATGDRGAVFVVRDLRVAQEKAFATPTPTGVPVPEDPEQSDAWRSFKDHWFQGAYACEGDECGVRQPTDILPARTPSSASTRRTTSRANSSTSPARRPSSGTPGN